MSVKNITLISVTILSALLFSFTLMGNAKKYKCLIQMKNYTGEKAYVIVSLINPNGEYEETLYVNGKDDEWYNEISDWWKFYGKKRNNLDAISGATIGGGERSVNVITIDEDKIDKGYSLRFETAVEDQEYHTKDVEFKITPATLKGQQEGKGFIRYVRIMPN